MQPIPDVIWLGLLGGIIPDALRVINDRHNPEVPTYFKSVKFWIGVFLLMGLGALVNWLVAPSTAVQAILTGYSAPSIFSKLAAKAETDSVGDKGIVNTPSTDSGFSMRRWWSR